MVTMGVPFSLRLNLGKSILFAHTKLSSEFLLLCCSFTLCRNHMQIPREGRDKVRSTTLCDLNQSLRT